VVRSSSAAERDDPRFRQIVTDIDAAASRRIDTMLSSQQAVDRVALTSLAATYRAAAPESYRSRNSTWVAAIKRRLGDLTSDPAAHNAYLAAVQGALTDVPALQSLRPVDARPAAPAPSPQVAANQPPQTATSTGASTAPANGSTTNGSTVNGSNASGSTAAAAAVQPPQVAAPAAAEPSLMGNWCSEGVGLAFASNEYSFELGGGRTIKYPVVAYERAGNVITMSWTDKNLGSMVTEFGEFSADGQSMVQMRGKTAASPQWQTYNRRFRRCK
jgi:hypothetical protein